MLRFSYIIFQVNSGMNKQYSKKQIYEAIRYWENVLTQMNESKSKIIDALIKEFGNDIIKYRSCPFGLSQNYVQNIYDVLNSSMFTNKIKVPIKYVPEQMIVKKLNEHIIMSHIKIDKITTAKCYGVHSAAYKPIYENGRIVDVTIFDNIIMINSDTMISPPFMFSTACICHEMIHEYDALFDECHQMHIQLAINNETNNDEYLDFHNTTIFNNMMKYANDNGINVIKFPTKSDTFDSLCADAVFTFENVIDETELSNIQTVEKDGYLNIHDKKTGCGVFIDFIPAI